MTEAVKRGGRPPRQNVSEPEALEKRSEVIGHAKEREESDLRHLLAQGEFRRYVWRWMGKLKMWSDALPLNNELTVQATEKRTALRMWREIQDVNPDAVLEMMRASKHGELE